MPRKPRFNLIGIPQHVIQRGNNREPCFYAEQDCRRYLCDLQEVSKKYNCRIHAYVLMMNHVHMLVTPTVEHGISWVDGMFITLTKPTNGQEHSGKDGINPV